MNLDPNAEPVLTFQPPPFAPNGGDMFVTMYTECRHRWWEKARDWIRFRRHPEGHILHHSPLYTAATAAMLSGDGIDFHSDTIRVALFSDGTAKIDMDGEK